ncbi:MAG: hypothetical protein PHQ19_02360, partial [Candidatus Krumholzibacteria bacterium]|nr:hypothetical protein [Candidatus Krumholzibacteria bacterium]
MANVLKRAAWGLRAGTLRRGALRTIERMKEADDGAARSLAAALEASIRGTADEAEAEWIRRI